MPHHIQVESTISGRVAVKLTAQSTLSPTPAGSLGQTGEVRPYVSLHVDGSPTGVPQVNQTSSVTDWSPSRTRVKRTGDVIVYSSSLLVVTAGEPVTAISKSEYRWPTATPSGTSTVFHTPPSGSSGPVSVSYTHLRAHETRHD